MVVSVCAGQGRAGDRMVEGLVMFERRFGHLRVAATASPDQRYHDIFIEFKRTQDMRSNYAEEATKVAQRQYSSLLEGLRAVGQVKGWQTQQIVFVGGTCGSVHVESFNNEGVRGS